MAAAEKPPAPRVLLCGDVHGRIHQLCKRVLAVSKSNGPFDCLLCVGQFFPSSNETEMELKDYISGAMAFPLPTFFIGDYGEGSQEVLEEALLTSLSKAEKNPNSEVAQKEESVLPGTPICQNLQWLRGSGVVEINGLQVAYLGGRQSSTLNNVWREQVERLVDQAAGIGIVDILLTNEWPLGVLSTSDKQNLPAVSNPRTVGTTLVAELAKETKPRYHVAGSEGVFFSREPYVNPNVTYVTRFLGLATVGNDKKQKFLHALSPTPASHLPADELGVPVPGSTPSPYEEIVTPVPKLWHGSNPNSSLSSANEKVTPVTVPAWALKVESEEKGQEGQFWRYSGPPPKRKREGDGGAEERICFEFRSKGSCSRGDGCRYKHVEAKEEESLPKGVCFDFIKKGKCERGDECRYRHSSIAEEKTSQGLLGSAPKGVCYDWLKKGSCERGSECRFRHSTDPVPPSSARTPAPCWFCLSSPEVESHLVVSIADHSYVTLAKGPLISSHVLILPIEHFPNMLSLPSDALDEITKYKTALKKVYEKEGKRALIFERYMQLRAGTHAHVQVVPVPEDKVERIEGTFQEAAQRAGFSMQLIGPGSSQSVADAVKKVSLGGNYFTVEMPTGSYLVYGITPGDNFPLQFGREVVAEILGLPERADWKACKLTKEEEVKLVEDFKQKFEEFDLM